MDDQNRTLRELVTLDSLFVDFPSLSDFDETYTCDVCTDTHLCSVCAEIEAALQVDISSDISYDISTDKVDVADVNVVSTSKILSSIEQPSALELKSLPANLKYELLEFEQKFPVIISSKLESEQEHKLLQVLKKHKEEFRWTLVDIPEDKDNITFTCSFDTFTFRRMFFDPGIKSEGTDKNFKVNGHRLKLFHESPTLEEEIVEELSLGKATYSVIYPP